MRDDENVGQAAAEAYRRLSKSLHPDAGGTTEQMQDLNAVNDAAKKFRFSSAATKQTTVEVDTRGSKSPAAYEPEAEMSEMGRIFSELPPEQKMRSRAGEERDAVCNLVRWKLAGAIHNAWRDDLELVYQAKLAEHRLYSAEEVDALMKSLWVAENWTQELLLTAVKALGI